MSEKAKNLRKTMSKNKGANAKKQLSTGEIIPEINEGNTYQVANTEPCSSDIDPLSFFNKPVEEPKNIFSDLISSAIAEKKEKEKEHEFAKGIQGFTQIDQINQNRLTMVKSSRIKGENRPTKLITSLDPIKDEAILKRFNREEKPVEPKVVPGKIDKINLPEMSENQKLHFLTRLSSARQEKLNMNSGALLAKKGSETILEKAKMLENKIDLGALTHSNQVIGSDNPNQNFILKDPDVQIVNELNTHHTSNPITQVDIDSLMNPNNEDTKNEKKSIADILLKRPALAGKKKRTMPQFDPEKKE